MKLLFVMALFLSSSMSFATENLFKACEEHWNRGVIAKGSFGAYINLNYSDDLFGALKVLKDTGAKVEVELVSDEDFQGTNMRSVHFVLDASKLLDGAKSEEIFKATINYLANNSGPLSRFYCGPLLAN